MYGSSEDPGHHYILPQNWLAKIIFDGHFVVHDPTNKIEENTEGGVLQPTSRHGGDRRYLWLLAPAQGLIYLLRDHSLRVFVYVNRCSSVCRLKSIIIRIWLARSLHFALPARQVHYVYISAVVSSTRTHGSNLET